MFLGSKKSVYSNKKEFKSLTKNDPDQQYLTPIHLNEEYIRSKATTPLESLDKLVISKLTILSLSSLSFLQNLTRLELPNNDLTELEPLQLESLTKLTYLNLSHNRLDSVEGIRKCRHLQVLNLSYNRLESMQSLHGHSLCALIVSHNQLKEVPKMKHAQKECNTLLLSHNAIESLSGLKKFPSLKRLALNHNQISTLDARHFKKLDALENLNLSNNQLESVEALQQCGNWSSMQKLRLSTNAIWKREDIEGLGRTMSGITELHIFGNPVCELVQDWTRFFPQLRKLNDEFVNEDEKREYEEKMQRRKRMNEWQDRKSSYIAKRKRQDRESKENKRRRLGGGEDRDDDDVPEHETDAQGRGMEITDRSGDWSIHTNASVSRTRRRKKLVDREAKKITHSEFSSKNDWEHKKKRREMSKLIPTLKSETQVRKERNEKKRRNNDETLGGIFQTQRGDGRERDFHHLGERGGGRGGPRGRGRGGGRGGPRGRGRGGQRGGASGRGPERDGNARHRGGGEDPLRIGQRDHHNHRDHRHHRHHRDFSQPREHNQTARSDNKNNDTTTNTTAKEIKPPATKPTPKEPSHDWDQLFESASKTKGKFQVIKGTEKKKPRQEDTISANSKKGQEGTSAQRDVQFSGVVQKRSASLKKIERIRKQQSKLQDVLLHKANENDGW